MNQKRNPAKRELDRAEQKPKQRKELKKPYQVLLKITRKR